MEDPKLYRNKIEEFKKAEENQLKEQIDKIDNRFRNAYQRQSEERWRKINAVKQHFDKMDKVKGLVQSMAGVRRPMAK